jgi:hypothetical protein
LEIQEDFLHPEPELISKRLLSLVEISGVTKIEETVMHLTEYCRAATEALKGTIQGLASINSKDHSSLVDFAALAATNGLANGSAHKPQQNGTSSPPKKKQRTSPSTPSTPTSTLKNQATSSSFFTATTLYNKYPHHDVLQLIAHYTFTTRIRRYWPEWHIWMSPEIDQLCMMWVLGGFLSYEKMQNDVMGVLKERNAFRNGLQPLVKFVEEFAGRIGIKAAKKMGASFISGAKNQ